ncbi:MAG TPA: hypothetical protein VFT72_13150 [Opitutaceae bacterium]|nr:hypothetical protein [Opitutaceae bacterium]
MKKIILGLIASLLAVGVLAAEKESPLHFPVEKREAAGIALAAATEEKISPEVTAYGRVLDPSPLIQLIAEVQTARAATEASEAEKDRAEKLLAAGGNASPQTVEVARAAAARDRATLDSARIRLRAGWGKRVSDDPVEIQRAIAEGGALARVDVLSGDRVDAKSSTVRVSLVGRPDTMEGEILGPAPTADAQMVGVGYLVLVRSRVLPSGAALRATFPGTPEATTQIVFPRDAVVYHQGSAWAFVRGKNEVFERRRLGSLRSLGDGRVAVAAGVSAGEELVVSGADQMLAAELQASGSAAED